MTILSQISEKFEWLREPSVLFKRIKNKFNDSKFSIRDKKLIKRKIKDQVKERTIDIKAIWYHLPGKSLNMVRKQCKRLIHIKRWPKG